MRCCQTCGKLILVGGLLYTQFGAHHSAMEFCEGHEHTHEDNPIRNPNFTRQAVVTAVTSTTTTPPPDARAF